MFVLINRAMKCLCGESEFKQIKIEALLTSSVTYSIVKGLWVGVPLCCTRDQYLSAEHHRRSYFVCLLHLDNKML